MSPKCLAKPGLSRGSLGMIFLAIFLLGLAPAYGGTISENFNNNTYDQTFWGTGTQGQGPSTVVTSNRLEITIPATASAGGNPYPFGGQIGSRFELVGDFDVQVDFNLFNWPAPVGVQVGIGPAVMSGSFPAGVWLMNDPDYKPNNQVYEAFLKSIDVQIGNLDNVGKLRLTRTGTTLQAFYWASSGWVSIAANTDPSFGANCGINFYALSHNFQAKKVQVAFDNIEVTYTKIRPFGTRNPPTGILPLLID